MPRKTLIIFIVSFMLAILIGWGVYSYLTAPTQTAGTEESSTGGFLSFLNPFAKDTSQTGGGGELVGSGNLSQETSSPFRKITEFAVAGGVFLNDTRGVAIPETINTSGTVVPQTETFEVAPSLRYVDRATGHINQMYLDTKIAGKISNVTIPAIHEVIFGNNARTAIYRYLDQDGTTINSFMATLGAETGEFLPDNIVDVSISPDGTKMFYLVKDSSGVKGFIRGFEETKTTQIWTSSYSEWISQWATPNTIFLTTKSSGYVAGAVFSLDTTKGTFKKILGGVRGLTTLVDPTGTRLLYGVNTDLGMKMGILTIAEKTVIDLNVSGLPEKCLWNKSGTYFYCAVPESMTGGVYPDAWYQGVVSFNDRFVKGDAFSGELTYFADSNNDTLVDATKLSFDNSENTLFFINKKDSTLWALLVE